MALPIFQCTLSLAAGPSLRVVLAGGQTLLLDDSDFGTEVDLLDAPPAGSTALVADLYWRYDFAFAGGDPVTINLTALSVQTPAGSPVAMQPTVFGSVLAWIAINNEADPLRVPTIARSAGNPWLGLPSGAIDLPPGPHLRSHLAGGWPVTPTSDGVLIDPGAHPCSLSFMILGSKP